MKSLHDEPGDFTYSKILKESPTPGRIVGEVLARLKLRNPKLSLAMFGKKIGLKASSNHKIRKLANDIIQDRRKISPACASKLCEIAGFHPLEQLTFKSLVEADFARKKSKKEAARKMYESLKKAIPEPPSVVPAAVTLRSQALRLLAAFGLAKDDGGIGIDELIDFFGHIKKPALEKQLQYLLKAEAIKQRGRKFVLADFANLRSDLNIHKARLREVEGRMNDMFSKPAEAAFLTLTVSVKKTAYQALLERFRKEIFLILAQEDSPTGADMLVDINLSILPTYSDTSS